MSRGNGRIKYFGEDISPFVGMPHWDLSDFDQLAETIPGERPIALIVSGDIDIPKSWNIERHIKVLQMIYSDSENPPCRSINDIVKLYDKDVPQMLALTQLTKPGPFLKHTIDFGEYYGIFREGKLAAMAGERLQPVPYVEISAVCTHPDFVGQGLAGTLLNWLVEKIKSTSAIPFLHVSEHNEKAIKLYQKSGFKLRRLMNLYVIRRRKDASIDT